MRTDPVELMELFVDVFGLDPRPQAGPDPAAPSLFQAPMAELAAPSRTLADSLAGQPDLVGALIARWRADGDAEAADVLAKIAAHLATRATADGGDAPVRRLDYVYPVV